jgi:ubiquinone/menaquinone biosynthesis C-methylase UbiE
VTRDDALVGAGSEGPEIWLDRLIFQLRPEITAFYEDGREAQRLSEAATGGPLEFARTIELMSRYLEPAPLDVLDVGGGPGSYAAWLRDRGDRVLVIDPVRLHVEQARARSLSADLGDARQLPQGDRSVDVVLLMGPLYHLTAADERSLSLAEAHRVLRPGGLLIATAISRFAALQDLLVRLDRLHEPGVMSIVERAVRTGVFDGSQEGLFTTAFFHSPQQLHEEIAAASFEQIAILNVEGPGFLVSDLRARWADAAKQDALLAAARLIESTPDMLGAASHLMAVARTTS